MDSIVESLEKAYQEVVIAMTGALESKEVSGAQKTPATNAALESFKLKWEFFKVACDQAEDFLETVKQRISKEQAEEFLETVDEATGSTNSRQGGTGLMPISAV